MFSYRAALFSTQMRRFAFCLCLFTTLSFHAFCQQSGPPGVFDYYLLTLSWSPEYCHSSTSSPECTGGHHFGFIVHGLWPQFQNGSYPEDCSDAPGLSNPGGMLDIMPDPGLIQHEWQTHGTCSGLSAQDYFALMRRAFTSIKIPGQFTNPASQQTLSPMQIKADFERANSNVQDADLVVTCSRNYLKAVEICLTKSLSPMACPTERSCPAPILRIAPVR